MYAPAHTTAGAIIERNPATHPIRKQIAITERGIVNHLPSKKEAGARVVPESSRHFPPNSGKVQSDAPDAVLLLSAGISTSPQASLLAR
jgi:hypothetical protein